MTNPETFLKNTSAPYVIGSDLGHLEAFLTKLGVRSFEILGSKQQRLDYTRCSMTKLY